ncbi:carotenoid oxygenase [Myriangium duriaei CBS 260.36]|uniref:Carotenoid oxygenase n=1 Tax=Myriangium duriaei CBS 260.36 TaxID=1168546 RepID=A0A9P4MPH1_9PEZI|nr:carotenoid oxygenase [Myriangium duriaei CBS 260.36]
MVVAGQRRRKGQASAKHPYLAGNYAPIQQVTPLTPCTFEGHIPDELSGGEYVRNGGNPVSNEDLGRDSHWFDGDGMLSGVAFTRGGQGNIIPEFVNQFVLTDVFLSSISSPHVKTPILPSIATLVNPLASFFAITLRIMRTILLVLLSFLPGSKQTIKKISVANTSIWYHDGRALAGCESGPPLRINLPGLETVGWYNGAGAENEPETQCSSDAQTIGGGGLFGWMREWTTAHPKVDPDTKEMLLFHSSFVPPYVQYSVIPEGQPSVLVDDEKHQNISRKKLVNLPLPGVSSAKMMHDFGVSSTHSVIMDLPLSLDPLNLLRNRPVVEYDQTRPSRFGVFPRHSPHLVKWFETKACCIFHTANTWDGRSKQGHVQSIHMLACRLTSASTVFSAGNISGPQPKTLTAYEKKKTGMSFFSRYDADIEREQLAKTGDGASHLEIAPAAYSDDVESTPLIRGHRVKTDPESPNEHPFELPEEIWEEWTDAEEDQCRLYYYDFELGSGKIKSQYALSRIPFEFPSVRPDCEMKQAKYIYGCSTSCASFGAALGKSAKIDVLVKIDAERLIADGEQQLAAGTLQQVTDCVDKRTIAQVLENKNPGDTIQAFQMPFGWFAQEPRFVAKHNGRSEDDGYLLTYAFNEAQLDVEGDVPPDEDEARRARSELWIIDAKDMKTVVGRVLLPQRVPYGLHGTWFSEAEIQSQRAVQTVRSTALALSKQQTGLWMAVRGAVEKWLA